MIQKFYYCIIKFLAGFSIFFYNGLVVNLSRWRLGHQSTLYNHMYDVIFDYQVSMYHDSQWFQGPES